MSEREILDKYFEYDRECVFSRRERMVSRIADVLNSRDAIVAFRNNSTKNCIPIYKKAFQIGEVSEFGVEFVGKEDSDLLPWDEFFTDLFNQEFVLIEGWDSDWDFSE